VLRIWPRIVGSGVWAFTGHFIRAKVGRKPKPAAVKELAGNPGKRAIKPEVKPESIRPRVPTHLSKDARRCWDYLAPKLFDLGLLTRLDRETLAAYCESYALWVEAKEKVNTSGLVLKTMNGNLIQNPYLSIANKARDSMVKIGAEFGLSPSSRVGLPSKDGGDPLEGDLSDLFGSPVEVSKNE